MFYKKEITKKQNKMKMKMKQVSGSRNSRRTFFVLSRTTCKKERKKNKKKRKITKFVRGFISVFFLSSLFTGHNYFFFSNLLCYDREEKTRHAAFNRGYRSRYLLWCCIRPKKKKKKRTSPYFLDTTHTHICCYIYILFDRRIIRRNVFYAR